MLRHLDHLPLTRRAFFAATTGAAILAVTSCSSDDSDDLSEDRLEVPGGLGTIEVPPSPSPIVSVGQYRDTDAAVALGVIPALSPDLSKFVEGGITPWVKSALNGQELELIDVTNMPYEAIAARQPELILATDRNNLDNEYDQLSAIAPTMSWDKGYNKDDWRTTTTRIGHALGKTDAAHRQIEQTDQAIANAQTQNPDFEGLAFTLGPVTADGTINTINSTTDSSAEFLAQLGLVLSPRVTSLPQSGIPGRAIISPEELELLDADVLMLTFNTPQAKAQLEANPLFQALPAVQRGAYVPLDLPTALAIGFPSALSVRYGLDQIVPKIRQVITVS